MTGLRDLAIVGAGPAGLAAAVEAARLGLDAVLVDEQPSPGGQIYRGVETASLAQRSILGEDYTRGGELVASFRQAAVEYRPSTQVWRVGADGVLDLSPGRQLAARRIILSTGALERPVPFQGWTLPGVMTAGAAQIMMKTGGVLPAGRVALAGTGPLLLLVAAQMLRAGVEVVVVAETTRPGARLRAGFAARPGQLTNPTLHKGFGLLAQLRRHGVRQMHGITGLEALGTQCLDAVRVTRGTRSKTFGADLLLVHFGVVPDVQAARSLGLAVQWDAVQLAIRPVLDEWGRSANPVMFVAGDGAGIAGAEAAVRRGQLAALAVATDLGLLPAGRRDRLARPLRAALQREAQIRPLLDRWFKPSGALLCPPDSALVCRCESLPAGRLRKAARGVGADSNAVKAVTRCGMGACGGRQCGAVLARLTAEAHGQPLESCLPPRTRPPLRPIRLGALAGIP